MKKITCLIFCLLVVLSICSCKDKNDSNDNAFSQTDNKQSVDAVNEKSKDDTAKNDDNIYENDNDSDENKNVTVSLYFPDNEAMYLHEEKRNITINEKSSLEYEVVKCLFDGPESEELSPALDGENLINSVTVFEDGLCIVDFKSDFVILNTGGSAREMFVIDSIVKSLCALDGIDEVKINIDGNDQADFGGHFMLDEPFGKNSFNTVAN